MIEAVIICLAGIVAGLGFRLFQIHRQLRKTAGQLLDKIANQSCERLSLELVDNELNLLVTLVNDKLEQQEQRDIAGHRKEKAFQQMIESLSHDLRTPLTAMKGNLQLLKRTELNEIQCQRLNVICSHAEALEVLIGKFWEYSCATAEDQLILFRSVDLQTLIIQCIADHIPQFESRGQTVLLHKKDTIRVWADIDFCRRIVENLLQNCLMHAAGEIEITFVEKIDTIVLNIQNVVIENQNLDITRMFDRFYTGDPARRQSSGLGLAVVRQLAQKQKGDCWAEINGGQLTISVTFLKDSGNLPSS